MKLERERTTEDGNADDEQTEASTGHRHAGGAARDDKVMTQNLKDACIAIDLKLVDHVIIGDGSFYSFVEGGLL